jgi:hypothetical protein
MYLLARSFFCIVNFQKLCGTGINKNYEYQIQPHYKHKPLIYAKMTQAFDNYISLLLQTSRHTTVVTVVCDNAKSHSEPHCAGDDPISEECKDEPCLLPGDHLNVSGFLESRWETQSREDQSMDLPSVLPRRKPGSSPNCCKSQKSKSSGSNKLPPHLPTPHHRGSKSLTASAMPDSLRALPYDCTMIHPYNEQPCASDIMSEAIATTSSPESPKASPPTSLHSRWGSIPSSPSLSGTPRRRKHVQVDQLRKQCSERLNLVF